MPFKGFVAGMLVGMPMVLTHHYYDAKFILGAVIAGVFALLGFVKIIEIVLKEN